MDIIASIQSIVILSISIVNYCTDIKGAPEEWADISAQVDSFRAVLEEYIEKAEPAIRASEKTAYVHIEPLIHQIHRLFKELQALGPKDARGVKKLWKRVW